MRPSERSIWCSRGLSRIDKLIRCVFQIKHSGCALVFYLNDHTGFVVYPLLRPVQTSNSLPPGEMTSFSASHQAADYLQMWYQWRINLKRSAHASFRSFPVVSLISCNTITLSNISHVFCTLINVVHYIVHYYLWTIDNKTDRIEREKNADSVWPYSRP